MEKSAALTFWTRKMQVALWKEIAQLVKHCWKAGVTGPSPALFPFYFLDAKKSAAFMRKVVLICLTF